MRPKPPPQPASFAPDLNSKVEVLSHVDAVHGEAWFSGHVTGRDGNFVYISYPSAEEFNGYAELSTVRPAAPHAAVDLRSFQRLEIPLPAALVRRMRLRIGHSPHTQMKW